ncbi:DUF3298 domain-containing protein [Anaerotignum lactatifermentans]|uniref:DUF3298 domain-containing protein n=1 Tax=Anaerotignum lactatifermentans TaxID=160404 RepID=A0ABS2G824_9FIRM|nr:DUF3298 and DUF4163 domain-containing protein [Anaerotignum lactatifermentans]MBM6829081.1 DUF3298 domain-containing protein [Anaerotignum lactatifermentans]MBM6877312.1 DUF3298 domain-containing protein [Anaerotignum lactatifermentans]MBM6950683.1 DUF3298 domain-containing protein [Anaerotignum lactatifermentans]
MREAGSNRSGNEVVRIWKEEFEGIPVPEETRARVLEGIRQARAEKKRRGYKVYCKRTGIAAAGAVLIFGAVVNLSAAAANAMEGIPVIGSIARVVTFRTYADERENTRAEIEIPQLGKNAAVNEEIMAYAGSLIRQYEAELAADQGMYSLESTYQVVGESENYISIQINTVETRASGAEYIKIFTVDLNTGEAVSLASMLKDGKRLEAVSRNILEQMEAQMAEDNGRIYFIGDTPDAFQSLTGEENFYFNEKGNLVIVFGEYQVAPGFMGVVSFEIPEAVSGISAV